MKGRIAFYSASNSKSGFYSFFDNLTINNEITKRYIIKGGPGSGKSSFMKHISIFLQEKGYAVEEIYCSSDPNSLDGILCPKVGISIVDGTTPHVVEPKIVGAVDNYINFSAFWDVKKLENHRESLSVLQNDMKQAYRGTYKLLACVGILDEEIENTISVQQDKLQKRVENIAKKTFPKSDRGFVLHKRLLSAISFQGEAFLKDTISSMAKKIYYFQDNFGLADKALSILLEKAKKADLVTYACYSPLNPEKLEHLIFPTLSLAFTTQKPTEKSHTINLNAYVENAKEPMIDTYKEVSAELMEKAREHLLNAKKIHDDIESFYINAMDFERVNQLMETFLKEIML